MLCKFSAVRGGKQNEQNRVDQLTLACFDIVWVVLGQKVKLLLCWFRMWIMISIIIKLFNTALTQLTTVLKPFTLLHNGSSILPPDVLIHIFEYLTLQDLPNVNLVCKSWFNLSCHDRIWNAYKNKLFLQNQTSDR